MDETQKSIVEEEIKSVESSKKLPTDIETCIMRVNESKLKFKRRRKIQQKAVKKYCSIYAESDPDDSTTSDSDEENSKFSKKLLKEVIFDTIHEKKSKFNDDNDTHYGDYEHSKIDSPLEIDDTENDESLNTGCIDAPQLKLDANGNIVIDEESLIIRSIAPDKLKSYSKAIDITNQITLETPLLYNTKKTRSTTKNKWSIEDTIRFYQVLSVVGTDFQTMTTFFPGKNRDNLKKKFKCEEKLHLDLIDRALSKSLSTENEYLFQKIVESEKIPPSNDGR